MVMDYEDEWGTSTQNPRDTQVITEKDYGEATKGKFDSFCRENILKRGVTTRLTDANIEFIWGRGGNTVYLEVYPGELEYFDKQTGFVTKKNKKGELDIVFQSAVKNRKNVFVCDLWDPEIVGTPFARAPWDSTRVRVLSEEQVAANIRNLGLDPDPGRREKTLQQAYMGNRENRGNLRPVLVKAAVREVQTNELSATLPQAERRNHHMVSVLKAQRKLRNLHQQRRERRSDLVKYPMTGCSPKGRPVDDSDRVGWRDAEYRSAIRQRRGKKDPFGLRQKRGRDLPLGLYYRNGRYMVRIGNLDIDGLRVLAHNAVERESRTSKQCYEQLMEALVHKARRGTPEEQLQAWEILARYGEDGLRTGSRMFWEEIFGRKQGHPDGSDSYHIYPDDLARIRAFRRPGTDGLNHGYSYEDLKRDMQKALHAAYHVDPALTPVENYNPFWTTREFETRYGQTWYTTDLQDPNRRHAHKSVLDLQEEFIAANFDRTMPSEQYRFRKTLSQLFGAHDKQSFRSRAKALRKLRDITIHVISGPTPIWTFQRGHWVLEFDWSTFDYFAEGIEAFRDWVRMIAEWQQTKAMKNAFDAMAFTRQTADQGRTRDFGGIWNSVPIWQCWAYRLLYWYANSRPSVLDEHGMPQFDAAGNRLWKRRAPLPTKPILPQDIPVRGANEDDITWRRRLRDWRNQTFRQVSGETMREWRDRVRAWETRYPNPPLEPVRQANEPDSAWDQRLVAYQGQLTAWQEDRDDKWIEDIKSYEDAVKVRVAIMGWAWHDRDPLADMPHDGVLRALTVYRWADWLDMMGIARGFNSQLGDGFLPDHTTFIKEQSTKVRNYRHETEALESDEGALYDPQGFWDYLGAVIRDHVVNFLNYRLSGTFEKNPQLMDVLFDGSNVYQESATRVRNQLLEMWKAAPIGALERRLLKVFEDAKQDNVIHIRPVYVKFLSGLPSSVIQRLQPTLQTLNRRSDLRVREWAQHLSVGSAPGMGKRVFKQAQKFIDEMYGTDTGEQLTDDDGNIMSIAASEQKRQDDLGFMGWMNDQYDKAAAFIRGLIVRETGHLLVDPKHLAEVLAKTLEGGLYHDIAWEMLGMISEKGIFLKAEDFWPSHEEFLKHYAHFGVEEKYETRCKKLLGTAEFRIVVEEKLLFPAMKDAKDPKYAAAA